MRIKCKLNFNKKKRKGSLILLNLLFVVFVSVLLNSCQQRYLKKAENYYTENNYPKAIKYYKKVYKMNHGESCSDSYDHYRNATVSFQIADCYRYIGDTSYCNWYSRSIFHNMRFYRRLKSSKYIKMNTINKIAIGYYYIDEPYQAIKYFDRLMNSNFVNAYSPENQYLYFESLKKIGRDSLIEQKKIEFEVRLLKLRLLEQDSTLRH
jgi:tetratricopeptide (TPR) repeat protein